METIFEYVLEIFLRVLLIYPGAFFRWSLGGYRKPFSSYMNGDAYINSTFGMIVLAAIILIYKYA